MATKSIRQQLKERIAGYFENFEINAKPVKVFLNSPDTLEVGDLPALCIQCSGEDSKNDSMGYPANLERSLNLTLTCFYTATQNLDTTMDDFALQVEQMLNNSAQRVRFESSLVIRNNIESISFDVDTDICEDLGQATLRYNTAYYSAENALNQDI